MGEREMFQALAIAISAFLAIAQAQDTTYCPDGWDVIQGHTADSINCILLGGLEERVTKKDAELICGGHDGWLVEIQAEHNGHHGNHKKPRHCEAYQRQARSKQHRNSRIQLPGPMVDWSNLPGTPRGPQPGSLDLGPLWLRRAMV